MGASALGLAACLSAWLILLCVAAAMTALETALTQVRMRDLLEEDGVTSTAALWLRHAPSLRAAAATGHTLAMLLSGGAIAVFTTIVRRHMPAGACVAATAAMVVVTLVAGELSPRYAGAWCARAVVLRLAPSLRFVATVTSLINRVLLATARACARLAGIRGTQRDPFTGDEEHAELADTASDGASMALQQQRMIKSIFEFGDTIVREIMTPRTAMDALPLTASLDDGIRAAMNRGRSRIPVYDGNTDHIVGVFYVRDALACWDQRIGGSLPSLSSVMRAALFVPETKRVADLLSELRRSKSHIAIVVDEYGGTSGLVTIEDLLEEIVGDIRDEYAADKTADVRPLGGSAFIVDAALPVYDINDSLNVNLPVRDDFDTLGGYLMYKLGRLPHEGETIEEPDLVIKVLKVTGRRVEELELTVRTGLPTTAEPTTPTTRSRHA